ncbi:HlyD family secretion protein [Acinetobacter baumannii]|nr:MULTISPECIES: HlyD family efflux transporter periplasmic adaptor subunit [Acinetobacter]AYX98571.1 HlyD family efflux transporter periplasmic adaptor subunit [Acinetobacter sp. FDAARGOS_493]EHU1230673.1 HlyD family efflux transporter periplasmic adaptor subunit [Acinetobacter baumannii]EHU1234654.1 HlyD family efflux transporter periplasmic adaptor subunit [Acinetobacter baumannii]EHU1246947.1 HlyD family efflux transporter periplasmic adaptor subunit [Acinetobacter baumannii]EHU1296307.1 H
MSSNLFRKEALDAKQAKWTGDIILSRPFSFTFLTICALCVALVIIAFAIWGSYTKRSTVQGQLIPQSGLIQVYTTQSGTVLKKNVYEGQSVKKGDILFTISIASYGEQGSIADALAEQTQLKEQSIRNEITRMRFIHQDEKRTINNQISLLKGTLAKVENLISNQRERVNLAKKNQQRYSNILHENAISHEEFEARKIDYLDQLAQYESLQREKVSLEKQLTEQQISLSGLENRQNNQIEQLERLLSSNTQELIEMQSRQHIAIQANSSGVIGTINAEVGQFVDLSKPLLTVLDENTPLIAQLYVPSRAVGFVKEGDQVLLRYQAYPYQKFGHAKAQVLSVAKTALASQDLQTIGIISPQEQLNNEPVYLVRAKLDKQIVKAYGKDMPLQVGMTLEGDIMHEQRKLYEWVLEPLFSITGKL